MAVLARAFGPLGLTLLAAASPALAQSALGPAQIGTIFCAAAVAGDFGAIVPLLTPEVAGLATSVGNLAWHSGESPPAACMPVGATGTADHPESVLFMTFPGGVTATDRLVLSFVDGQLRVSDVVFANGHRWREDLAAH